MVNITYDWLRRNKKALDERDAGVLAHLARLRRCQKRIPKDRGQHYTFCGGYETRKEEAILQDDGSFLCAQHSRKPWKKILSKKTRQRDLEEIAAMFASRAVRCFCGHMKQEGFSCPHCNRDDGMLWPNEDERKFL